jgi:hypothetical protein
MRPERAPNKPTVPQLVSEVLSDSADLFRKELRLARAEVTLNLTQKFHGALWFAIAGLFATLCLAFALAALSVWMATFSLPLHLTLLWVAGLSGLLSLGAILLGKSMVERGLAPARTINQVSQDIQTAKEQFT